LKIIVATLQNPDTLISMTQIKVELQSFFGSDSDIAAAAWTSSLDYQKKKTRTTEDVERVVKMLADAKHSTPFESVVMRFWIKMPIAIDRQFMTHRLQSASGMSGRYRTMPSEYLEMTQEVVDIYNKVSELESELVQEKYTNLCKASNDFYNNECIAMKAAVTDKLITNDEYKRIREFLRGVLPQHNMTERVSIMNLRAWANFIKLRLKPEAQPEIQEVARLMLQEVKDKGVAPIAIEWLEKNGWNI
jgi:flavin-dependent thymidylate synthase